MKQNENLKEEAIILSSMVFQTCDSIHIHVGRLLVLWAEDFLSKPTEEVREPPEGLQCTEDINLEEDERKEEEHEGHDSERSTSCQEVELDGERCGDSNQHHVRKKKLEDMADKAVFRMFSKDKTEQCKGGDTQANSAFPQTESVGSIDGTKPPDVGECLNGTTLLKLLNDTSQTEKGEDHNHPPLETLKTPKTCLKLGKQRQVFKKGGYGSRKLQRTSERHVSSFIILVMVSSRFGFALTASAPVTRSTAISEPRGTEMLPPACSDNGSKFNDTWLDRREAETMIRSGILNASYKGYTNVCSNAFHGFPVNEIDLSFNNITEIPDDLFENVPGLERVHLGSNRLTSFPVALNKCPDLVFFNISCNDIRNIPRNSFNKATNLLGFDASGNINLSQYPDDLFYLPNCFTVYLGNTAISNPPFLPHSNTRANESFDMICEKGQIIRFVRENREVIFYLQNTDALSPRNWEVKVKGDPEGRVVPFNCENQSFGPFEINVDEKDRSTIPTEITTLNNSVLSSTVPSVSNATQPQNDFSASQKDFNAGVVVIVMLGEILVFYIYMLYMKGKDTFPCYDKVGALAFVVKIAECVVAWFFGGRWVALSLVLEALVAVIAIIVCSCVLKRKLSKRTHGSPVSKNLEQQTSFTKYTKSGPKRNDQS